jgi:hypothetical protein
MLDNNKPQDYSGRKTPHWLWIFVGGSFAIVVLVYWLLR